MTTSSSSIDPTKRRILVVDDNPDAALSLSMLLQIEGHETAVAHSGREAIDVAPEFEPDVALLDIGLPEMNGYELATKLRASYPDLLLVAVSGYGEQSDLEQAKKAGFNHHFLKPVDHDEILKLLTS